MEVMNPQPDSGRLSTNRNLHLGIGSNLVNHANRLGIKLRSAGRSRTSTDKEGKNLPSSRRANTAVDGSRNWAILNGWTSPTSQTYVQNAIVPLSSRTVTEEDSTRYSPSKQTLSGENKGTLPHMRSSSAHSNRSTSTYLDKYVSSTPTEAAVLQETKSGKKKVWNVSGQALRYQHEKNNKEKSRTLQRTSVVQPHRIDRMYYISGTSLQIPGKYEVDEDEMDRLQDMARIRKEATHYGRGLSNTKRNLVGITANEDIQVPQQQHSNNQMENVLQQGPLSAINGKDVSDHVTPGPSGDGIPNNNSEAGLSLKGVGIDGKKSTHTTSVTVHVVNEDNTKTPHNSARTDKTNGTADQGQLNNDKTPVLATSSENLPSQKVESHTQVDQSDGIVGSPPNNNVNDDIRENHVKDIFDSKSDPGFNMSDKPKDADVITKANKMNDDEIFTAAEEKASVQLQSDLETMKLEKQEINELESNVNENNYQSEQKSEKVDSATKITNDKKSQDSGNTEGAETADE